MTIGGTGISIRSSRTTPNRLSAPNAATVLPIVTLYPLLSALSDPPRAATISAAETYVCPDCCT
jgi:hypothetical protein